MKDLISSDFNGHSISFTSEAWFNATQAAAKWGKEPTQWLRQRETAEYIDALARHMGYCGFLPELNKIKDLDGSSATSRRQILALVKKVGLVKTRAGAPETGGGTWMHPKLGMPFARWLDLHFAIWCDEQIDNIVRCGILHQSAQNMIPFFLREAPGSWELRFNDAYYTALARVTGTTYTGHAGGTPAIFGKITDKWVYGVLLPKDVHDELRERKDNSTKMHQWLTNGGHLAVDFDLAHGGSQGVAILAKELFQFTGEIDREFLQPRNADGRTLCAGRAAIRQAGTERAPRLSIRPHGAVCRWCRSAPQNY
ncbi:MAG: P63C domain-containing protein [Brachymonas sp.]|nr:P63C domain-containing protein [Brachymonas sp.]